MFFYTFAQTIDRRDQWLILSLPKDTSDLRSIKLPKCRTVAEQVGNESLPGQSSPGLKLKTLVPLSEWQSG